MPDRIVANFASDRLQYRVYIVLCSNMIQSWPCRPTVRMINFWSQKNSKWPTGGHFEKKICLCRFSRFSVFQVVLSIFGFFWFTVHFSKNLAIFAGMAVCIQCYSRSTATREPFELESFCKKQHELEEGHPPYRWFFVFEAIRALLHCQNEQNGETGITGITGIVLYTVL